ncbi:HAD family hydrolase [Tabrizicola piscis]|uniref:HAD family hydrolase n=1 Tax=Tabrizicola piscis TaxID=2494374 RepID=A0A3S8U6P5_9RHOB|nr:HAD family hydrolase [Tabrizicola piscis]AZL59274.1 HAD family hydrolase [Tabrizicola piscis]
MKIAMWSGPRNLSTALMYAFAARGDCAVSDEPFYAAYLAATGVDHPMRDDVIASQPADPNEVAAACLGPNPGGQPHWYQKHMTLHMIPAFDRGFLAGLTNVFLLRHPAHVIASYARKREAPTLQDIGFLQQAELFDQVADMTGTVPPVITAESIRANPRRALAGLCSALGLPFTEKMLSWPSGPKPYDGVWAPHWYNAVHRSTGFEDPEGPLPDLPPAYQRLADAALPAHDRLAAHAI